MKFFLDDIFARFEAEIGHFDYVCLRVTQLWPVEITRIAATPKQSVFDKFRLPKVET